MFRTTLNSGTVKELVLALFIVMTKFLARGLSKLATGFIYPEFLKCLVVGTNAFDYNIIII